MHDTIVASRSNAAPVWRPRYSPNRIEAGVVGEMLLEHNAFARPGIPHSHTPVGVTRNESVPVWRPIYTEGDIRRGWSQNSQNCPLPGIPQAHCAINTGRGEHETISSP